MRPRRSARDLGPVGPVGILDRAFTLAREGGLAVWGPSWLGGGLLAAAVLSTWYVERVEGITSLRPLLALALVCAWWARAYLLGRSARRATAAMWDTPPEPDAGRAVDVLRTAVVVGLGLWCWSWLLVVGSLAGPLGVVLVLPLFVLRGAIAPSWIARSACTTRAGWRCFLAAARDSSGQRVSGVLSEGFLLIGALGLALDLFGVLLFAVILLRSFGGFELSALESFVSPENTFVLMTIAALALVLFEPLRAAHSAAAYVGARVRAEGLDLRVSVEAAIEHSSAKRGRKRVAAAAASVAVLFAASLSPATLAHAQPDVPAPPLFSGPEAAEVSAEPPPFGHDPGAIPYFEIGPQDSNVQTEVDQILARPEFREFEDDRGAGLRDLLDRMFQWLLRPQDDLPEMGGARLPTIPLPGASAFILIGVLLLLGVGIYLFSTSRREEARSKQVSALAAVSEDIRDRAPTSFLDEAALLAEQGRLREALRALYLATLVALDRRRWIAFDPHLTNWQYLRQMPRGPLRDTFRSFTRLFDHKWYGQEDTTPADYERCRALAADIVEREQVA